MQSGLADDLSIALACSDRAAELALTYFQAGVKTIVKPDGSPVTEADPAVEQLLRQVIEAASPGDEIVGEELGRVGDSARVWILDPIDGTSHFARHQPHWRVHVALCVDDEIEVAVVTAPALGVQWWAQRGQGAYESAWPRGDAPTRLAVSTTAPMSDAVVDSMHEAHLARFPPQGQFAPPHQRGWCAGLIDLVRGQLDAYLVEGCQLWDHAPWILLVEEAGGRFTSRKGTRRGDEGGGLYSNAVLHPELVRAIGYQF